MKSKTTKTVVLLSFSFFLAAFPYGKIFSNEAAEDHQESPPSPEALPSCTPPKNDVNKMIDFANMGEEVGSIVLRGSSYSKFNDFLKAGVPEEPLRLALDYFEKNKKKFSNKNYISIADYSINSKYERFFMLDLRTGAVVKEKVSHGGGQPTNDADPDHDGMLDRCTHKNGSRTNMTRPGFFKTDKLYRSSQKWPEVGKSEEIGRYNGMRLEGLEERNSDAMDSGVVMHEAKYNSTGKTPMGRSYGCPAFAPGKAKDILANIKGGSLFYAHVPQCEPGAVAAKKKL